MPQQTDRFITELGQVLEAVPAEAADAYDARRGTLTDEVNRAILEGVESSDLTGSAPPGLLRANHENHARFMVSQMRLGSARTLARVAAWAYSVYTAHGVPIEYFPAELAAWRDAVRKHLAPEQAEPIAALYDTLRSGHDVLCAMRRDITSGGSVPDALRAEYKRYLSALLKPDMPEAVKIARRSIARVDDISRWWQGVIQPAMYEVGRRWARGELSVGQEHLATSITQRVMALFYPMILDLPRDKGSLVVAASPGELHEIGPRMLSDMLEMQGWDTHFTGASTPIDSIVDTAQQVGARALCVSTTLSSHLGEVADLIRRVRADKGLERLRVLVGGQAYHTDPELWTKIGADGYGLGPDDAIDFLQTKADSA